MLIHDDGFIKVYNDNGYLTVSYLDISHHPVVESYKDKHTKETRWRVTHTIKQENWKIFHFDCPRTNFERVIKEIAKQRMKHVNGKTTGKS